MARRARGWATHGLARETRSAASGSPVSASGSIWMRRAELDRYTRGHRSAAPDTDFNDVPGRSWHRLGGSQSDLLRLDPRSRQLEVFRHDPELPIARGQPRLTRCSDRDGLIWAGTWNNGAKRDVRSAGQRLCRDAAPGACRRPLPGARSPAVLADPDGSFWFGSSATAAARRTSTCSAASPVSATTQSAPESLALATLSCTWSALPTVRSGWPRRRAGSGCARARRDSSTSATTRAGGQSRCRYRAEPVHRSRADAVGRLS